MRRFVELCVKNSILVNIITIGVILIGFMFLFLSNREAFPKVEFDWVLVTTIYPGATASDVEKHISIPLEDQLREVNGIKKVISSSLEARSVLSIQLDPDLDNKDRTINDIQSAIDRYNELPEDSEDPIVTELSVQQTPVLYVSLINKNGIDTYASEDELRMNAKILKEKFQDIDGVAKVNYDGYRDREVTVEVDPEKLDFYHVAINDVINTLSKKNINFPGGSSKKKGEEILIRTIGEVEDDEKEISNILIRSNELGNWVKIANVAKVRKSFDKEVLINKAAGYKAITITVLKNEASDIIDVVDETKEICENFKKSLPENYDIVYTDDLSYYVKRRLNVLLNNGIIGFILVVATLLLAFGWKISLVTAIGLPLAFAGTFIWMGTYGVTINLISMFGLIIVLGMLVDDAIIVAENIYRYLEEGYPLKEAVITGTNEVIWPVAGTIMTTVAVFAPLLFMSGIIGKFIWALPAVVSVALLMSWIESMFILPSHIYDMEKKGKKKEARFAEKRESPFKLRQRYVKLLDFVLHHKIAFVLVMFVFFVVTIIFGSKNVKFILFPAGGIETLIVKVESESGTTVQQMSKKLSKIERIVAKLPDSDLDAFVATAGIIQLEPNDPMTKRGANYGMIKIHLTPIQGRKTEANEILDKLRNQTAHLNKEFRKLEFEMIKPGPPTGKPVQVDIKGESFEVLQKISNEIKEYLKTITVAKETKEENNNKGKTKTTKKEKVLALKDIQDNFEERKKEYRIYIKEREASITGISVFDIAQTVRSCYEGTVATEIKKSDEEIDIRVILPEKMKDSLASLDKVKISNKTGNLIPLNKVAEFKDGEGISVISRKDWKRTITVSADIDERAKGVTSLSVNNMLKKKFKDIDKKYPGYRLDLEGEFKDTQESMEDLMRSFIIAIFVIYVILVWIFRTLHHPIIVMSIIPLTFLGVIWAFFVHGLPLSFMAMMGIVGLTGVIVNDSIVLVVFINNARKVEGKSIYEATLEAGYKRLRPIILTSVTTVAGLMPTAYGWGGLDPFLVPMAVALSWGLAFGTLITLFATPLVYNIFYLIKHVRNVEDDHLCEDYDSVNKKSESKQKRVKNKKVIA